jgi:hypothetical protein
MGASYTVKHACILAEKLPNTSRTMKALSGDTNKSGMSWGIQESLLAYIEYNTRVGYMAKMKHADRQIRKAKVLQFSDFLPKEAKRKAGRKSLRKVGVSYDEAVQMLEMRSGVNNE